MHFRNFLCKRGLVSVTAVLMLLIMFATLTGIILAFESYNVNTQEQMRMEQARSQEKITISKIIVDDQNKISSVIVNNIGTVEVKIRALYVDINGEITFLDSSAPDPSTHMDTYIAPGKSLPINLISKPDFRPEAKIIAATERGVKTMDYEPLLPNPEEPPPLYDPKKLYAGPLMLTFDAFYYQDLKNGFNPDGTWLHGGSIPIKTTCAWKISVTNIGDRDITLTKTSSITTITNGPSSVKTWFLDSSSEDLIVNEASDIIFIWDNPDDQNTFVKIYDQQGSCMIFLTFFGYYHDQDQTPYAQTIPFEATVLV